MVYSATLVKVFAATLLASTAVTGLQLDAFEVVRRDHVVSLDISPEATEEPELTRPHRAHPPLVPSAPTLRARTCAVMTSL